jgi:hypothetical protein
MSSNDNNSDIITYLNLDVSKLSYSPDKKYTRILYDEHNLLIKTYFMYCPFGLEKEYNNFYIKIVENEASTELFNKIREIEKANVEYIQKETGKDLINYNSQIFSRSGYKDFFKLKLLMKSGQFLTNVFNKQGDRKTVYSINPKSTLKFVFEIDTIWFFKDKYSSVCKIKTIIIDE